MAQPPEKPDTIHYDKLMYNLRLHLVRHVLEMTARSGLMGGHFFQLTIKTLTPGVVLPDYLKERYPREIILILQHRFERLQVIDEGFHVTLYFHGKPENIFIPWQAIMIFQDPSVPFGLQVNTPQKGFSAHDLETHMTPPLRQSGTFDHLQKKEGKPALKAVIQEKGEIIPLASHRLHKQHPQNHDDEPQPTK